MYKLPEGVDYSYKAGVPGLYNEKGELVKKAEDMSAQELSTYEADYRRRRGAAQIKADQQVNAILKAEQEAKRKAAAEAKAKAEAKPEEAKPEEAKPEAAKPEAAKPEAKPKPAGQKLVWNKQRMDFDTPDGKPAPYPKVEPKDIDIRGLSAYRPGGALPRLSSTGVSASSSPTATTPTATTPAPAAPKPEGVSAGLKKWASIYGPGGPKELKQPTPSQRRLFKYTHPSTEKPMEAYDVVLDYLLSEGHAETVEEAHYVMMQLDSEYIQTVIQERAWWDPAGLFTKNDGEKALEKPAKGYNPKAGTTFRADKKHVIVAPLTTGGETRYVTQIAGNPNDPKVIASRSGANNSDWSDAISRFEKSAPDVVKQSAAARKEQQAIAASKAQLAKDEAEARARAQKLADEDAARETQASPPIVAKPKPAAPIVAKPKPAAPVVAKPVASTEPKPVASTAPTPEKPKLSKLQQDLADLRAMRAASQMRQQGKKLNGKIPTGADVKSTSQAVSDLNKSAARYGI